MSTTFLLVCFIFLKESTRKNSFYFMLKALFILEIIKFQLSRYWNVMASSMLKHETWNTFYGTIWKVSAVWLWNFASLCNIIKPKFVIKLLHEKCDLETSSTLFSIFKGSSVKDNLRSAYWLWQILLVLIVPM